MPTLERSCCFEHKIGGHGYDYMITIIRATSARALIHPCICASVHPRSLFLSRSLYRFNSQVEGVGARGGASLRGRLLRAAEKRASASKGARARHEGEKRASSTASQNAPAIGEDASAEKRALYA